MAARRCRWHAPAPAFYPQFVPADGPVLAWTAALALLQVTVETVL